VTRADEIATEFGGPSIPRQRLNSDDTATAGESAATPDRPAPEPPRNGRNWGHRLELEPDSGGLGSAGSVGAGPEEVQPATPAHSGAPAVEADEVIESPYHESLPQLARTAAGAWLKAAGWTAGTSLRVGNELRKIATDPNGAQEVIEEVREVARDFLGITELDAEVQQMAPLFSTGLLKPGGSSPEALRAQGAQLLREAADVGFDEGAHPAFARILSELSPDEARILRLLSLEGPQPIVDIRAHNLIGNGSQLIAASLNMLGPTAGALQPHRVVRGSAGEPGPVPGARGPARGALDHARHDPRQGHPPQRLFDATGP
jgi:hypothetical protein